MRAENLVVLAGLTAVLSATAPALSAPPPADLCARCHESQAALVASAGGHAPGLDCLSCHADRRPGRFGPRHRSSTRCATHHGEGGHPPRERAAGAATRNCLACHDVHGSSNAELVRPLVRNRRMRLVPIHFDNPGGATPGGFTDPADPGRGLCEVCHRHTDFYRSDGRGEPHFTESCVLCHAHAAGFAPVISDASCTICHGAEGARFAKPSLHSSGFACSGCHAEGGAEVGPGHRRTAPCGECHVSQSHAPFGAAPFPCTQCHDPHGTDNTQLVLDVVRTPQGADRPIRFDNLLGRADASFASASAPGTGICEVCHTTTRFYRADASGEDHFAFSCLPCHLHGKGFSPQ